MIVQGEEIDPAIVEALEAAMRKRTRRPFTFGSLSRLAQNYGVKGFTAGRLADRLIQNHRRAGDLVKGAKRGQWRWVEVMIYDRRGRVSIIRGDGETAVSDGDVFATLPQAFAAAVRSGHWPTKFVRSRSETPLHIDQAEHWSRMMDAGLL